ncbi:MAG: Fuc2NAc and GlcNAc transferase [Halieaceae bacterium]|jgi:Fuc2NAc and GlcNAc transferase
MAESLLLSLLVVAAVSFAASGLFVFVAHRLALFDLPNQRSSHQLPVPRGGGVAIVLVTSTAYLWLRPIGLSALDTLFLCGGIIAVVAFLDDLRSLPAWVRFAGYSGCAVLFLWLAVTPSQVAELAPFAVVINYVMLFIAIMWSSNLYNFMDGIDGLAAGQAIVVLLGAASLLIWGQGQLVYTLPMLVLASAVLGFLPVNWAPARLFMGDAGSVYLGFMLAGFALLTVTAELLGLVTWLILLGLFISDASYTLIWRIASGQRFLEAHRLHLYQRLTDRWNSHTRVVLIFMAVNILWLLPLAWAAEVWPEAAVWLFILAYSSLLLAMVKFRHLK